MENLRQKVVELGNGEKYAFIETGKGAPLLLIHGNMSSGVHFSPILPALAEKFHCFAPDLRGFGDSSYNKPFGQPERACRGRKAVCRQNGLEGGIRHRLVHRRRSGLELAAAEPQFVKAVFPLRERATRDIPYSKKTKRVCR